MRLRVTLEARLAALLLALMLAAAVLAAALEHALLHHSLGPLIWIGLALGALGTAIWAAHRALRPVRRLLRALSGAVASYHDGDFGFALRVDSRDELGELRMALNELGNALREQRAHLTQRELLLDTVTQNSPVALLLVDAYRHVVYTNLAARHLLGEGRTLNGQDFDAVLARAPEALRAAYRW